MSNKQNPMTILSFQVDGMRERLKAAIMDRSEEFKDMINEAINNACTVENVKAVLDSTASTEMRNVIREEVERFYRWGEGRIVIREAIEKHLSRNQDEI